MVNISSHTQVAVQAGNVRLFPIQYSGWACLADSMLFAPLGHPPPGWSAYTYKIIVVLWKYCLIIYQD